jgi:YesN/AraC family two-component response regulator
MLSEEEAKKLVVYSKWFNSITEKFNSHMSSLINSLSQSIIKLEEEYELTLGDLNNEIVSKENELSDLYQQLYNLDANTYKNNLNELYSV